jgi:uncharacterized membrane protein
MADEEEDKEEEHEEDEESPDSEEPASEKPAEKAKAEVKKAEVKKADGKTADKKSDPPAEADDSKPVSKSIEWGIAIAMMVILVGFLIMMIHLMRSARSAVM